MTIPLAPARAKARPGVTGSAPWIVSIGLAALIGGWLVLVGWLAVAGPGDYPARDFFLYLSLIVVSALVVGARGLVMDGDRVPWLLFAAGMLVSSLGDVWYLLSPGTEEQSFPSFADALYLAYYPLTLAAVVAYVRHRVRSIPASIWRDGAVLATAVGSLVGAVFLAPLTGSLAGGAMATAVGAAYPMGDTIVLLMAAMGMVLTGRRNARALTWIAGAMAVAALADLSYWNLLASDKYVEGTWLDALWPLSSVIMAIGAWFPGLVKPRTSPTSRGLLLVPGASLVAAAGTLVFGSFHKVATITIVLAILALLGVLNRLNATMRQTIAMMEARKAALTDDLTGLPNRRGFALAADATLRKAAGAGGSALLVIDLDGFKEVNDSLGHLAGDDVLRAVTARLVASAANHDVVFGRLGGDEFAALVPTCTTQRATTIAVGISKAVSKPVDVAGTAVSLTASIGIAIAPRDGRVLSDLLRRADIAMYRAKANELDAAVFDPEQDLEGEDRLQRAADIRDGLAKGDFVLHYQPKVALDGCFVEGVEALVRWRREEGRLDYPDAFLPLARTMGLMPALTDYVVAHALDQAAQWRMRGLDIPIAVNVPASALVDESFAHRVVAMLAARKLPGTALQVEITEEALLRDAGHARQVLGALRDHGVKVALDDYGTGYSSLNYLRELVVDHVKIDRSFIESMHEDPRSQAIVRSTINLAHELGLLVVAEGIETEEVARSLADYGCDAAQGYLWSKPIPADELDRWLEEFSARATRPSHGPHRAAPSGHAPR